MVAQRALFAMACSSPRCTRTYEVFVDRASRWGLKKMIKYKVWTRERDGKLYLLIKGFEMCVVK